MTKYRNKKIVTPDGKFDSRKEYRRFKQLKRLEEEGIISDLRRQVKYQLIPKQKDMNGKVIERECNYYADFVYISNFEHAKIVEDVKGMLIRRPEYVIKRKLMLQIYGLRVREV